MALTRLRMASTSCTKRVEHLLSFDVESAEFIRHLTAEIGDLCDVALELWSSPCQGLSHSPFAHLDMRSPPTQTRSVASTLRINSFSRS